MIIIPGVNGLGKTHGVEKSYLEVFSPSEYEKISLNSENIRKQLDEILSGTREYFSRERECFFGGDHSISYPLVKNFFSEFSQGKLIVFDAHPDLMRAEFEPTHEEWLRALIDEGILNPKNVLIAGVRRNNSNVDLSEINYALQRGIKIIYADEFDLRGGEILEFVSSGKIYCSFDVDVFDNSIVSCTGYPESGGLSEEQVFWVLGRIAHKISFFDLVEINFSKCSQKEAMREKKLIRKILKTLGFL